MTNRQWLIWEMIDMHPYELGQVLSGGCDTCVARPFCKKEFPPNTAKPQCHHIITKWLQQEHKECGEEGRE